MPYINCLWRFLANQKWELLHNKGRHLREKFSKFFSGNDPSRGKACGESELDIFEAKKRFPDSGKACYVLKRKVTKMRFLPKNDPFRVKMCGESEFDIYKIPRVQEKRYIGAKIRF
jgi:hypothetical protein